MAKINSNRLWWRYWSVFLCFIDGVATGRDILGLLSGMFEASSHHDGLSFT